MPQALTFVYRIRTKMAVWIIIILNDVERYKEVESETLRLKFSMLGLGMSEIKWRERREYTFSTCNILLLHSVENEGESGRRYGNVGIIDAF